MGVIKKIKKINFVEFLQGLTLLILSIVLAIVIVPISVLVNFIYYIAKFKFQSGINELGLWMKSTALSIDQFGNVTCATVFNFTLIKKDGEKFGDPDLTISCVLGLNKYKKKLTIIGKLIVLILHLIERNHVEKAIERQIESDQDAIMRIQKDEYYG